MKCKKFILSLLFFFLLFMVYICFYHIEKIDLNNIMSNKEENDLFVVGISSKNNYGAFDNDNGIYFFSDGFFDKNNIKIVSPYKTKYYINELSDNEYEIIIYCDKFYQKRLIKIVDMSILSINSYDISLFNNVTNRYDLISSIFESNDDRKYSNINVEVMDSEYKSHSIYPNAIYSTGMMRLRGSTSLSFEKKSYKVELNDKISLLGMNSDDDWILDALYTDKSKIRNKLSSDLWNLVNNNQKINNDINGEFVEVFIDNQYKGLYVLKEKVDKKITGVESDGLLAKSVAHATDAVINEFISGDALVVEFDENTKLENYEIKYYTDVSIENFVNKLSNYYKYDDFNSINDSFDISNYINYHVFIIFINGVDNITKNQYYSMSDNDSKILITPWDLDLTFGIDYCYSCDLKSIDAFHNYYNLNWIDNNIVCNIDDETKVILKQRYWELRESVITMDTINGYLDSYKKLLVDSGAALRDSDRWYEYDIEFEIERIREWAEKRIDFLDEYFK